MTATQETSWHTAKEAVPIREALDTLADLRGQLATFHADMIDSIIAACPDKAGLIKEIVRQANAGREILQEDIAKYSEQIKASALAYGKSVKGVHLMATHSKGKLSWDSKALTEYAKAHPDVLGCKVAGKPSVSIRKAKH